MEVIEELCCKASGYPGNQLDFFISAMQNIKLVSKDNRKKVGEFFLISDVPVLPPGQRLCLLGAR